MEFYRCKHCGNIIAYVDHKGVNVMCCGEEMERIVENTVEASTEKHLPVVKKEGNHVHVQIGSVAHPMEEKHYIQWIALETKNGNQRKILTFHDTPAADFCVVDGDEVVKAYEYCNIHGLWSTKL